MSDLDPRLVSKIDAAKAEIASADITEDRKDGFRDLLTQAYSCANGTPDKVNAIAETLSFLVVHSVRNELREGARTQDAINKCKLTCKSHSAPTSLREFFGSIAAQYPIAAVLVLLWAAKEGLLKFTGVL